MKIRVESPFPLFGFSVYIFIIYICVTRIAAWHNNLWRHKWGHAFTINW